MRKQLLLLLTMLSLPVCLLADGSKTVPSLSPAKSIKDIKVKTSRSATRADNARMGVMTELKYEKLPDMKISRLGHQTFASGDGLVVVGGHTTDFIPTKTAEIYRNGTWTELSIGNTHDNGFSAVLSDGSVMIGGGSSKSLGVGQSKAVDIYNPTTRSFTPGPDMSIARTMCKGLSIGNKVYVSGNWYADDLMIDYYDGSSFKPVGITDGRCTPYMMPDKDGNILIFGMEDTYGSAVEPYTYSDGSKGFVADCYNPTAGETQYAATIFSYSRVPVSLSNDVRSSDYHFKHDNENYYMILANEQVSGDDYNYKLFTYCVEDDKYYQFGDFKIPSVHPETGEEISYRGSVYVNEAKNEAYLIGSSVKWLDETVHIISLNYLTDEWTIASASGFNYDLMQGSWALLPDGRLACSGGFTDSNSHPSKEAYIFTPPTAGENGSYTPTPETGGRCLVVWLKSGERVVYELAESPVTTFNGTQLIISTVKTTASYERNTVLRYTYELVNTSISLQPGERRVQIDRDGNKVTFRGLSAGTFARVYSVNGMLVSQTKVTDDQPLTISLQNRPNGVYIIKAGTETIKLMKK